MPFVRPLESDFSPDTHENGKPTLWRNKANRLVTRELNFREFGGGEEMDHARAGLWKYVMPMRGWLCRLKII